MTTAAAASTTVTASQADVSLYDVITRDIRDPYYQQNFVNEGARFVAWYLRRVMLRDRITACDDITDGPNDKQMDAVIVDDDERRIVIVQGKFIGQRSVDSEPLREVLGAWALLQDLEKLQGDCNDKLKQKLEAVRRGLEDEYRVDFELLTTGTLTSAAQSDMKAFSDRLEESEDFAASLQLIDTEVLQTRLAEAEAMELPSLDHAIVVDPLTTLVTKVGERQIVLTMLPLNECLRLPGINDGRLFRKNVRQSLGSNNKVNRAMRATINSDKVKDFFYYHNGITALSRQSHLIIRQYCKPLERNKGLALIPSWSTKSHGGFYDVGASGCRIHAV